MTLVLFFVFVVAAPLWLWLRIRRPARAPRGFGKPPVAQKPGAPAPVTRTIGVIALVSMIGSAALGILQFDRYRTASGAMLPTLRAGDFILVDRSAYGWRLPGSRTVLSA
ncbi:MAG TPA: hypothetical protein VF132_14420, partial [Rudaea sp.]